LGDCTAGKISKIGYKVFSIENKAKCSTGKK
jgi:hypothetical protein